MAVTHSAKALLIYPTLQNFLLSTFNTHTTQQQKVRSNSAERLDSIYICWPLFIFQQDGEIKKKTIP